MKRGIKRLLMLGVGILVLVVLVVAGFKVANHSTSAKSTASQSASKKHPTGQMPTTAPVVKSHAATASGASKPLSNTGPQGTLAVFVVVAALGYMLRIKLLAHQL